MTRFSNYWALALVLVMGVWTSAASAVIIDFRNSTVGVFAQSGFDGGATVPGFALNAGADNSQLLVVTITGEITAPTLVTYAGQNMVLGESAQVSTNSSSAIWYLIDPLASSGDIVVTKTGDFNGYRVGAMSFGTDGLFLPLVTKDNETSSTTGNILQTLTLDDAASPGDPFLSLGAYGGNGGDISSSSGFDATIYSVNETGDGGYSALAGYAINPAGGTDSLSITQNSSRHAFSGVAISAVAVPEPSTLALAGVAGALLCCVRLRTRPVPGR